MRRLEGVIDCAWLLRTDALKRHSLLFDKLHLYRPKKTRDYEYLCEHGYIAEDPSEPTHEQWLEAYSNDAVVEIRATRRIADKYVDQLVIEGRTGDPEILDDFVTRLQALKLGKEVPDSEIVPICWNPFTEIDGGEGVTKEFVFQIAMDQFPVPGPLSAWEDIFDFKLEMHEKQWDFRRFLGSVATKQQTEAEVHDELEWTLNEYREGMKKRRIKIVQSVVAAVVVPAIDLTFNSSGNHSAALVAAGLAINKLRVELLEGEAKAPGRACAYIFEAQERFGPRH